MTYILPDGRTAKFSQSNFKVLLWKQKQNIQCSGQKVSQQAIIEDLAESLNISSSSIKHWISGHNAPGDLDKVKDLAKYFDVSLDAILTIDNQEDSNMNTSKTELNHTCEYTGKTMEDICSTIIMFIETYRMNADASKLQTFFVPLYTTLMLSRYSLPKHIFKKLCSYAENYLQQMIVYSYYCKYTADDYEYLTIDETIDQYEFTIHPWWGNLYTPIDINSSEYTHFIKALRNNYAEMEVCMNEPEFDIYRNNFIISTAYELLDAIMDDYHSTQN